jgi:hypothetical protein
MRRSSVSALFLPSDLLPAGLRSMTLRQTEARRQVNVQLGTTEQPSGGSPFANQPGRLTIRRLVGYPVPVTAHILEVPLRRVSGFRQVSCVALLRFCSGGRIELGSHSS